MIKINDRRTDPKVISPSLRLSARREILNETMESWINPAVARESTGVGACCCEMVYIYEINISPEIGCRCSYRLRKTHQPIKGCRIRGEIHAFRSGNSESMSIERESGDSDVVRDNIA